MTQFGVEIVVGRPSSITYFSMPIMKKKGSAKGSAKLRNQGKSGATRENTLPIKSLKTLTQGKGGEAAD